MYANTRPTPPDEFYAAPSGAGLADWKAEIEPHYAPARRRLGSATVPETTRGDEVLREIDIKP